MGDHQDMESCCLRIFWLTVFPSCSDEKSQKAHNKFWSVACLRLVVFGPPGTRCDPTVSMMPVWAKTAWWDCCQPFCDAWFAEFVFCARAKKEHVALKTLLKFFSSRLSHLIQMHMGAPWPLGDQASPHHCGIDQRSPH